MTNRPVAAVGLLALASVALVRGGRITATTERLAASLVGPSRSAGSSRGAGGRFVAMLRRRQVPIACGAFGVLGAGVGYVAVPVIGPLLGGAAGIAIPLVRRRRVAGRRSLALERGLEDVVAATALAIRSGQSLAQAVEYAGSEVEDPVRGILGESLAGRRMGTSLEEALGQFAADVGTEDARMFVMVIGIQARSGGNLAAALEEVATTIHHRLAVRRELHALSAQGRLSGAILGLLPIAFFVVLGVTSRSELEPVYRSTAGLALILSGLAMQGLAYLWIRRLLRVEG
jgi:tight adherence protein B